MSLERVFTVTARIYGNCPGAILLLVAFLSTFKAGRLFLETIPLDVTKATTMKTTCGLLGFHLAVLSLPLLLLATVIRMTFLFTLLASRCASTRIVVAKPKNILAPFTVLVAV